MNSRTPPLPTLMKKILPWTRQMVMKTEDSLVFSWERRHIPLVLFSLFWTLILNIYFSFSQFIFQVLLSSWTFIYMFTIYILSFTSVSSSHLMSSVNFPLFAKMLPWHNIFVLCNTFTNATKQRFSGYDESL